MEEKFNIVKKGYDPGEVNQYIDNLEAIVRSYKEKDAAIKNAIVNAQIAADVILEDAGIKAIDIIKRAEKESDVIRAEAAQFLDKMLESVAAHKNSISSFSLEYDLIIEKYANKFDENDAVKLISDASEIESYMSEIRDSIRQAIDN